MIIEGNQKELDAMKEFHKGNRQEGLTARKPAVITATARSAWRSTARIRSMSPTV